MSNFWFYAFIALVTVIVGDIYEQNQPMTLHVYHGPPLKGVKVSYNVVDMYGHVNSQMSYDYNMIFRDGEEPIDGNMCFDNIRDWCNTMIELSGRPVYLMTDTYYKNNVRLHLIQACQRKMFRVSGLRYD